MTQDDERKVIITSSGGDQDESNAVAFDLIKNRVIILAFFGTEHDGSLCVDVTWISGVEIPGWVAARVCGTNVPEVMFDHWPDDLFTVERGAPYFLTTEWEYLDGNNNVYLLSIIPAWELHT